MQYVAPSTSTFDQFGNVATEAMLLRLKHLFVSTITQEQVPVTNGIQTH
jgi:hypothetical protein